jgi:prevent-host-death family protein
MRWQVQEAKQRFSEVLRAVHRDGPQTITRHGEEVAVIVDAAEYHRLTAPRSNLVERLLGPPYFDEGVVSVVADIEADRKRDLPRDVDLDIAE